MVRPLHDQLAVSIHIYKHLQRYLLPDSHLFDQRSGLSDLLGVSKRTPEVNASTFSSFEILRLTNLHVADSKLSDALEDIQSHRAMRRVPRPAFLNQDPLIVGKILGTSRRDSSRQLNGDLI